MNSKLLKIGTSAVLASVVGVGAVLSCQLSAIAQNTHAAKNFLLSEKTKGKSNIILAKNSEEQTRIRVYKQASPAVVA